MNYPIQPNAPCELWLYSNGREAAWCDSKREFLKLYKGTFAYRAAHEGNGIPAGWRATKGTGLADDSIRRKTRNTNAKFFAGLQKALSEITD